jgi:KaiC
LLKDYNIDVQKLFLRMMVTNAELYTRVMNIMNPANFDKTLRPVAEMFKEHSAKYNVMPDSEQIKATTGIEIDPLSDLDEGHYDWFLDEFEAFTKRQELERAILKSADLLEKGEYGPVEKLIKDAVQISLQKDMGTDYFADPRARLMMLKSNNGQNSTGWPSMDRKLYGGFNRGELQIFAGGSGSGKSLFMQNLAVNWTQQGLSGVYITLELSEGLCSMRIDSMMTETSSRDIFKSIDDIEMKIKMMAKKAGKLRVKYMPAQSTVNDLRAYCKELQVQTGIYV